MAQPRNAGNNVKLSVDPLCQCIDFEEIPHLGDNLVATDSPVVQLAPELILILIQNEVALVLVFHHVAEEVDQHEVLLVHLRDHILDSYTLRHNLDPVITVFSNFQTRNGRKGPVEC